MTGEDNYKFLRVRDAITAINQKVRIAGVILEYGSPKKSNGTDYTMNIKIVDESHHGVPLSVNLFAHDVDLLPKIESADDIILLTRVMMRTYHGEVNAVFYKKFSSFALYRGRCGGDFLPYQCFSPSKSHTCEQSKKVITELRKWFIGHKLDGEVEEENVSLSDSNNYSLLREINEERLHNLTCKILHTCKVKEDKLMAFIWDGTDAPPTRILTKLDDIDDQRPLCLDPDPLPRDIFCTFPTVGTILRVILDKDEVKRVVGKIKIGECVKFLSIRCQVNAGFWYGAFTSSSKVQITTAEDSLNIQRLYDERLSSKQGRVPCWAFPVDSQVTDVGYDHVPFVTLMDVLTYKEVTAKYKCVVRVVAAYPWVVEDFLSQTGIYYIRLTLEDPTARIHAFLYAEDAEMFFGGYPSKEVLTHKRDKLLGIQSIDGKNRNPPWIPCCIKSYYIDKSDKWGSRNYRIFDTRCLG